MFPNSQDRCMVAWAEYDPEGSRCARGSETRPREAADRTAAGEAVEAGHVQGRSGDASILLWNDAGLHPAGTAPCHRCRGRLSLEADVKASDIGEDLDHVGALGPPGSQQEIGLAMG